MHLIHLRHALIATAALAGVPALAGTTTLPGTLCTSDAAVGRSLTGLMRKKTAALGRGGVAPTTYFNCPIIRTHPVPYFPGTLPITVNVKTASSNAEFACFIRSITASNGTFDQV